MTVPFVLALSLVSTSHADFAAGLGAALGCAVAPHPGPSVHGGSINDCFLWPTAHGPVFVKRCPLARRWILEAESDGLERLRHAEAIRVPVVLAQGSAGHEAFLALEWLDLLPVDATSDARLGRELARLHGVTGSGFGLERDNAIGATEQPNGSGAQWPAFWRKRRLGFQLDLAARNGHSGRFRIAAAALPTSSMRSSAATIRGLRCCMATSGAVIARGSPTARQSYSIRPSTTAIARRMSP